MVNNKIMETMSDREPTRWHVIYGMGIYAIMLPSSGFLVAHSVSDI